MDLLQVREAEIFKTLKILNKFKFVVIGGYAVNAYTLPRFSADCDIVTEGESELAKIEKTLLKIGYEQKDIKNANARNEFSRYAKIIKNAFNVSLDIMIGRVVDRQTGVSLSSDWIFKNSEIRTLRGKTITEKLKLRILDIDALFAMKMISCRQTDIRDIFMLSPKIKNIAWIRAEISSMYNFENRFQKVKKTVSSKEFRNGLQGVYGFIDDKTFEMSMKVIDSLNM